jgi:hypothetical protein
MTRILPQRGGVKVKRDGGKIRQDKARRQGITSGQASKQDDEKRRYNKERRQG